jgi:hypothetical protein
MAAGVTVHYKRVGMWAAARIDETHGSDSVHHGEHSDYGRHGDGGNQKVDRTRKRGDDSTLHALRHDFMQNELASVPNIKKNDNLANQ